MCAKLITTSSMLPLITFLTIEYNNLNIQSDPSIKSDMGQLAMLSSSIFWYNPDQVVPSICGQYNPIGGDQPGLEAGRGSFDLGVS